MGCQERVKSIHGYRLLFKKVFHNEECSIDDIAKAIATFERTVLSGNSPYDRYIKGDLEAMTPEQIHGYQIFTSRRCIDCHHGVSFSNRRICKHRHWHGRSQPRPGPLSRSPKNRRTGELSKFPSCAEVARNQPFMHDGSLATLEEVIDYYDRGGNPNPNLHTLMEPLHLTSKEKKAL